MSIDARRFQLARRAHGLPTAEDFELVDVVLDDTGPQSVVENLYFSVDPYHREEMDGGWDLHTPLEGRTIGRVLHPGDSDLAAGDLVFHRAGYATHALLDPATSRPLAVADGVPLTAYLGVLGGTGLTAYVGLTRIGGLAPGQSVFITAAAGAVGTAAGELARELGADQVIGVTGSDDKAAYLRAGGAFTTAVSYRDPSALAGLRDRFADGVQVALEGVGGEMLALAIDLCAPRARIAWVGAISQYNSTVPPTAPTNLFDLVEKRVRLEGYLVSAWADVREEFEQFAVPRVRSGALAVHETVVEGFEHSVHALLDMLRGGNVGKQLVRV